MAPDLTGNAWLMADLKKLKVDDLRRMHEYMQYGDLVPDGAATPLRRADLISEIEAKRRAHWDSKHKFAAPPGSKATKAHRDIAPEITASECNEWLRSLPPVPLYGEAEE